MTAESISKAEIHDVLGLLFQRAGNSSLTGAPLAAAVTVILEVDRLLCGTNVILNEDSLPIAKRISSALRGDA